MNDLETLDSLIKDIHIMKEKNYSLIPPSLNNDSVISIIQKARDFLARSSETKE
mgnify:CR=1 FL=1|tara:strand:+ start:26232 stop:26393 length:162 start_codon:yes stop_codon:yes gene_type:complete